MTDDYSKGSEALFDEVLSLCDRLADNYKESLDLIKQIRIKYGWVK